MQNKKGIMYLKHRYKLTKNTRCLLFFLILFTAFNVLSWNSVAFTDWYRLHVFPVWTGSLGRVSDLFSGSLGEALIVAGICYVLAGIVLLPLFIWKKFKKNKENGSGRTDACPGILRQTRMYSRIRKKTVSGWDGKRNSGIPWDGGICGYSAGFLFIFTEPKH